VIGFSYKEHDSTQETDSDDVVEIAEKEDGDGDADTEAIEKIMDHRVRWCLLQSPVENCLIFNFLA